VEENEVIRNWFLRNQDELKRFNLSVWSDPELSLQEYVACRNTADFLDRHGFRVETFNLLEDDSRANTVIGCWGSGKPVIAYLGELDALPELGQEAVPFKSKIEGPGHGCGHSMMLSAGLAGAAALKEILNKEHLEGTVIFMGCPGEEVLRGKKDMIEKGCFKDVDVCFNWHPQPFDPKPSEWAMQACVSLRVTFAGKAVHAVFSHEGRSALDAAELCNVGVQYLREHLTKDVMMHYVYLEGGAKANIVPERAVLSYMIRAKNSRSVEDAVRRFKLVCEGAAMMTETRVIVDEISGASSTLVNHTLNRFVYQSGKKIPEIVYDDNEEVFARELYKAIYPGEKIPERVLPNGISEPVGITVEAPGSTDMSDVSRIIPTIQLFGGGMLLGTTLHHWGVTAVGGSSIGFKSSMYAGRIMAQSGYDIIKNPAVVEEFWDELRRSDNND